MRLRVVGGAAAIATGAALLFLALPIALAGFTEIPGNAILKKVLRQELVPAQALEDLIRSREASVRWRKKGRTYTDLALARMMLGEQEAPAARDGTFWHARDALTRGLAAAPTNPYAWMRLVLLRKTLASPTPEIARALSLALNTGARGGRLLFPGVEVGLRAWNGLDAADRNLVADMVTRAWTRDPLPVVEMAREAGQLPLLARLLELDRGGDGRAGS